MSTTFRDHAGDVLLNAGVDLSLDRRVMEQSLAAESPECRGYRGALNALAVALIAERALLWLGWRLGRPTSVTG
jgi:hypothetical protein